MAEYDPKKRYVWTPEDKFELDGNEFGMILNAFRGMLSTHEAQSILRANDAHDVMEGLLKDAVEKGVAKEENEVAPQQPPVMQVKK